MQDVDFEFFSSFLKEASGLDLAKDKAYLLESRLNPVMRRFDLSSLEDVAVELRKGNPALSEAVIEAMTTNESSFFRDTRPFDTFRKEVLPRLIESNASSKKIRIWSAACSSGQEPYTLAMVLDEEMAKHPGWSVEIIGTDISNEMIDRAREGLYTQFEVQRGLPITLLVKYFEQQGDKWRINDALRSRVSYKNFNLLENMASLGKFDVIFCRNVLIYFDPPTKGDVLQRMERQMQPGAVLFLGGAETVLGVTDRFRPVEGQRGVYEVNTAAAEPSAAMAANA